jgi:hypothetical protein
MDKWLVRSSFMILSYILVLGCNQEPESEFRMMHYESKAWIDSIDFPTIKFYNHRNFRVYKSNSFFCSGNYEQKEDTFQLNLDKNNFLKAFYVNRSKDILRVLHLVKINTEASYGDFKRIK